MAVSLSEAWNDVPEVEPPLPRTAARRASVDAPSPEDSSQVAPPPPPPPLTLDAPAPAPPNYDEIVYQMEALRREEARRCTVYLAIGGILFAMLFMYVDRLNQQIRMLHTCLLHRQMPMFAAVSEPTPYRM